MFSKILTQEKGGEKEKRKRRRRRKEQVDTKLMLYGNKVGKWHVDWIKYSESNQRHSG